MSSNWRTGYPRNLGLNRAVNEDAITAESPAPGDLAVLARITSAPLAHNDGDIIPFEEDVTLNGFTSDGAGNYTCVQAGTYFIHAQISFAVDGVTAAWGQVHGVDVLVAGTVTLRQWSNTLATANYVSVSGAVPLVAGNVVKVNGKTTAGNIAIQGGATNYETSLSMIRVL